MGAATGLAPSIGDAAGIDACAPRPDVRDEGRWHGSAASPAIYSETLLLLGGAVVAAPLFKRIGLGTVLGYLAAGVAIGPAARLITGGEEILHVAELGIVFLLFIIGLELKPSRLWALRRADFRARPGAGAGHRRAARLARLPVRRVRLAGGDHRRLRAGAVVDRLRPADPRAGRHDQHPVSARRPSRSCCSRTWRSCRCWR